MKTTKIIPQGEHILVEPNTKGETTKSGLLVGKTEGDRTESISIRGTIIAIGKDAVKKIDVKVGDTIMIAKWEAQIANIEAFKYLIVKPKDILLKLEE